MSGRDHRIEPLEPVPAVAAGGPDVATAPRGASRGAADEQPSVREQTRGAISRSLTLIGSRVVSWGLALVMTIMMPRYLGAVGFGRLYLATSLTSILSIIVEFGLNSFVAREVARRPEDATRYMVNAGLLKTGIWALSASLLMVAVRAVGYPLDTQVATAVLSVYALFYAQGTLLLAVLQANDRMRWIALSTLAEKLVYVGLGAAVLLAGYGVVAVALATLAGALVAFVLDLVWFRRLAHDLDVHGGWRGLELRHMFVQALPFFSVLFFGAIYFRIDVIIMSFLTTDAVVGQYGAAYRLFQTTYILPEAFLFSLFPLFCRLSAEREHGLAEAAQKSVDVLLLVGLPLATGMCVLSDEIITTLYGLTGFAQSIPVLRVLAVAVALMYANGAFVQLLIATERQKRLALTAGIAAAFNLSLNLVLIRVIGALGAAVTTVLTETLVIAINFTFLPRDLTSRLRFGVPARAALAAAAMGAVLVALNGASLLVSVPAGVASYALGLVVFRAVPRDDLKMLVSAVRDMRAG